VLEVKGRACRLLLRKTSLRQRVFLKSGQQTHETSTKTSHRYSASLEISMDAWVSVEVLLTFGPLFFWALEKEGPKGSPWSLTQPPAFASLGL